MIDIYSSKLAQTNMYKELKFERMSGCYNLNIKDITININDLGEPDYTLDKFVYSKGSITGYFINKNKNYYVGIFMEHMIDESALHTIISAVYKSGQDVSIYNTEFAVFDKKNLCLSDFSIACMYGKKLYEIIEEEL